MNDTAGRRKDTRDIVKGALVNLCGTLARSLNFILIIVLGRLFGPEGVGMFLLTRATVDIFTNLGILGLNHAVLTLVARHHTDGDEEGMYLVIRQALTLGFCVSVAVSTGLTVLAPCLMDNFFNKPELTSSLRMMIWVLPFWTLSAVLLFATRALRIMQYEIYVKSMVEPAGTILMAVLFYTLGLGLSGLYLAVLLAAVTGTLAAIYCFSRVFSVRNVFGSLPGGETTRQLLRLALPIGFQDLINEFQKKIDIFLVGRFLSADLLGIYGIAQEAAYSIRKIRQAFNPIFIPVISASYQKRDTAGVRFQYENVTRWILILDIAYVMIVILAGSAVMRLFGAEFVAGTDVLVILTLALAINGILGVSELITLIDKPWINLVNAAWSVLASAGLNILLIPLYGIMGAAWAVLILNTTLNAVRVLQVLLLYKLQPFTRYHAKVVAAAILSIGAVWGGRQALGVSGAAADLGGLFICWILYFALLFVFGPAPEEKALVDRWRNRVGFSHKRAS